MRSYILIPLALVVASFAAWCYVDAPVESSYQADVEARAEVAQIETEVTRAIEGVYDLVSLDGRYAPVGGVTSGSMEFRADSTWVLSVSYEDLGAPAKSWGGYLVTEEKDGCIQLDSWPTDEDILRKPEIICNGVLTLQSSNWTAVFKKEQ